MDLSREIRKLEEKGVFIDYRNEGYGDGNNCNFSIIFSNHCYKKDDKPYKTGLYGDNHEFGDVARTMECSVRIANKLLYDDKLNHFFNDGIDWLESREYRDEFNKFFYTLYEGDLYK